MGTSDCPPAIALASPSCEAKSATASLSVAGQAYSKAGSFMWEIDAGRVMAGSASGS